MFSSLKARSQTVREDGFTLTELAVAVLILGILLAIGLPVFLTAQKNVSSLDVKTGLIQAASAIEAEKGDNNQLYPVYMPNEILSDSLWKTFAYTYSDDRLSYCLQGRDSNGGKWFVSSSNRTPSSLNCGLPNIAKNSETPWQIQFPNVDVSTYNIEWKPNASNPNGSVTWVDAQCSEGTTSYQLHIVNGSQGIDTKVPSSSQIIANNAGLTTFSYSPDLAGWLPGDETTVTVAAVCTVSTGGRLYTFIGNETGAAKNATVPQFPLGASSYSSAPAAYYSENADKSLTMKVNATFTSLTCPVLTSGIIGTNHPVYELVAKQGSKVVGKDAFSTNTAVTLTLSGFAPDTTTQYFGRSYCEFKRTSGSVNRYSGTDTTNDKLSDAKNDGHVETSEFSPVGFPSAPGTPTTVSTNGNSVKPDGLTWTAPSARICAYGGNIQYSYVQSLPGSSASAYSSATTTGRVNWAEATTYKYYINAKCVGQNRTSDVTPSASVSFTTSALTPAASWKTQYTTSYSSNQLLANGALNTISCPNGSAARYLVRASQAGENDVTYDGVSNSPTLYLNTNRFSNNGFDGDKLVTYTGYGYCRVTQFDNSTRDWPGTSVTSNEYAAVSNPINCNGSCPNMDGPEYRNVGNNPDVLPNSIYWDSDRSVTCPNGGGIQYQYVQTYPGNSTSNWQTNNWVDYVGFNPGTYYKYKLNYRCVGNNRTSGTEVSGETDFTARWNTPNTPSAPSGIWTDQYGYSGVTTPNRVLWYSVGCDRGATPDYFVRQVRMGGNYRNPEGGGYNDSGWLGNTTVFNVPDGWLRQGSQIGYQVTARCIGPGGTSDYNHGWSGERNDITGIGQPGVPAVWRNGDRHLNWNGTGCGQGAYAQYYFQQWYHNDGQWGSVEGGWGVYYDANVDGYNGYTQGNRVYFRCVGDNAISNQVVSGDVNWQIPVYNTVTYIVCRPGTRSAGNHASDSTRTYCGGDNPANGRRIAFQLSCQDSNPNWNGNPQIASGIYVNNASGLSATQLGNGRNNGDSRFGANGSAADSYAGGWTWGSNFNVDERNVRCVAGNGVASGYTTRGGITRDAGME